MAKASEELQEGFLYAYERLTLRQLGDIVPRMLSEGQVERACQMRQTGKPDSEVLAWIKSQVGQRFNDLHEKILREVVREVEDAQTRRGAWFKPDIQL
jgi:hypothetical protein